MSCLECDKKSKRINELEEDLHMLGNRIANLENTVEMKDIEVCAVTDNLADLSEYVQDLEKALAEAHLTSIDTSLPLEVKDP